MGQPAESRSGVQDQWRKHIAGKLRVYKQAIEDAASALRTLKGEGAVKFALEKLAPLSSDMQSVIDGFDPENSVPGSGLQGKA